MIFLPVDSDCNYTLEQLIRRWMVMLGKDSGYVANLIGYFCMSKKGSGLDIVYEKKNKQ